MRGGGGVFHNINNIISIENLFASWREFLNGKRKRKDVILFSMNLMNNIYSLHDDLKNKTYQHSHYEAFKINDPKPRDIHKAIVRDRLLHHAIYRILYPYFDRKFIYDSYSCRLEKGTHKAIYRFENFIRKVGKNNTKTCWVLKCDIKKFFANIDHEILKTILSKCLFDTDTLWLLGNIIDSFQLKVKYYIRYADDFVVLSEDKKYLENILEQMKEFLEVNLKLTMHPDKVFIKTISSGMDFLGWVHFPKHRVLRTSTKKRMFRNLNKNLKEETKQSYLGMLSHGDAHKLQKLIQ